MRFVGDVAHDRARLQAIALKIESAHRRVTRIGPQQSGEHFDRGCFPRAVRPEEREDFAFRDGERQALHGHFLAIRFAHLDHCHEFYSIDSLGSFFEFVFTRSESSRTNITSNTPSRLKYCFSTSPFGEYQARHGPSSLRTSATSYVSDFAPFMRIVARPTQYTSTALTPFDSPSASMSKVTIIQRWLELASTLNWNGTSSALSAAVLPIFSRRVGSVMVFCPCVIVPFMINSLLFSSRLPLIFALNSTPLMLISSVMPQLSRPFSRLTCACPTYLPFNAISGRAIVSVVSSSKLIVLRLIFVSILPARTSTLSSTPFHSRFLRARGAAAGLSPASADLAKSRSAGST